MADMIESTALDSTLLAGLQPLPHADRNRVVDRLARFDPPRDSRDDEAFYAWLLDHYRQHGSAEVDAALRSKGGNSARRTLSLAAALWAERALVSDGVEPFEVKGASLARLAELAREHGCLVAITILDWASRACAGEVARDDPPPGTVASGLAGDAPSPYDRLRSLLSRAEAESDLEVLASITRFADDLDQALLRIERQARSAAREAGRAAALRAYQDARAELPAGEASGLPDDPPGDGERLRATTIAMGTLSRALHVLMEARVARDSGAALSRAERQQRAIAVLDAEDDLVTARATLADLSTPDDADEQHLEPGRATTRR